MAGRTETFFDELSVRGHEPSLKNRTATMRFDVVHGKNTDSWIVAIDRGDIAVSRDDTVADCEFRLDRALFEAIVAGERNPMAATLRGSLITEGDIELLVAANRLLAAPPKAAAAPSDTHEMGQAA